MAFFWPCSHEGQIFFDLLAKIQARRIKRSNDWGKTLFFKKKLVLFIVELSVIFFSTLIFSTLNTTLNSTLDTLEISKLVIVGKYLSRFHFLKKGRNNLLAK